MSNPRIRTASINFFFAALLLGLFGVAAENNHTPHAHLQIALALLMGGAGAFLRTGTPEARAIGLIAAGTTLAAGAYALISQNIYIPGTIIAGFAIFRLWSVGSAEQPAVTVAPPLPAGPLTPFAAPDPYAGPVQPPAIPRQAPFFAPPVGRPDDPA